MTSSTILFKESTEPVLYPDALSAMESHVEHMIHENASEQLWFLEHPPLYTAGVSANPSDLLDTTRHPIFETGRGGQYTYHGPGQRIAYIMLNLTKREAKDIRCYVHQLEEWLIRTLAAFDITGERRKDRIGIWVVLPDKSEAKIAAIGIRVRKWITFHGIALNINPNLDDFNAIVPCGITDHSVTSFHQLGKHVTMQEVDMILKQTFNEIFGPLEYDYVS